MKIELFSDIHANLPALEAFFKDVDFDLSIKGDGSAAWLTITGQHGVKDFITTELQM